MGGRSWAAAWCFVASAFALTGAGRLVKPTRRAVLQRRESLTSSDESTAARNEDDSDDWASARRTVSALAAAGVAETSYLTWQKVVAQSTPWCGGARACADVLTGPYSSVGPVPLSLLGFAAYATVLGLSVAPSIDADLEGATRGGLTAVTAAMASFSICLVALLVFKLHAACAWCFASAFLSLAMVTVVQRQVKNGPGNGPAILAAASGIATTILAASIFLYAEANLDATKIVALADEVAYGGPQQTAARLYYDPPKVTEPSTARTVRLAKHLKATNAKMYGAYWCSHCFNQKQLFGVDAVKELPYVECAPDGANSKRNLCQAQGVSGYPTWQINGKLYPGEKSIAEIESLAGLDEPTSG